MPGKKNVHYVFMNKVYKNVGKWYMNKSLSKILQNIDQNKSVKFGVCECYWSEEKNIYLKMPEKKTFTMFLWIKCIKM